MKDFEIEKLTGEIGKGALKVLPAVQGGTVLNGVYVEVSNGDTERHAAHAESDMQAVELPNSYAERRKFLANWSEKNRVTAKKGLGVSILLLPLAACGGDESSSTETLRLIDGYIKSGFVFRDENNDGIFQSATEASAISGADGYVQIGGTSTAPVVLDNSQDPQGRTAIDLDNPDEPFTAVLTAPGGSGVVTPLTTMVEQLIDSGETADAAKAAVKAALGITGDVDVTAVDPIATGNTEIYKAGVQVAGLMSAAGGGDAGLEVTKALAAAVKTAADSSSTVNLTDADAVKAVVEAAIAANPTAMSGVDQDAVASESSAQASVVASASSIDDVAAVQSATFIVSESGGTVSFSGTATGAITMFLNSSGGATFSRAGVDGKNGDTSTASLVTVSSAATKTIAGAIDLSVVVSGSATAGDDEFVIDAPLATSISISGSTGTGADTLSIKLDDVVSGSADVRTVSVDTSNLSVSSSDSIVFDFDGAEDIVILSSTSDIAQFSTIEISKGTADLRSVTVKDGVDLIVNSGVILSQAQFGALDSLVSASGKGEVTIGLGSGETLTTLNALFATGA
ncbi:MAG: hypothetical protein P8L39_18010, partial [Halioglobus sp.]|nr:hypothetical protein [Halioglobus sp.]